MIPRQGPVGAALALLLLAAALLRFAGIDHHVRRGEATNDERDNFVQPVLRMYETRSLDPKVYSGYPGLFNYIVFGPVIVGARVAEETGAYVGGRALVAAFGVLNVFLMYRLGAALFGVAAGLLAATLLAFSRGEVSAAHYMTPDVLVVTAFLGAALLTRDEAVSAGREAWAWAVASLGTAVKYTGLLLFPALAAQLLWRRRLRERFLGAALAAALAFVLAAPFAVMRRNDQGFGLGHSLQYYYGDPTQADAAPRSFRGGDVIGYIWLNLGVVAFSMALAAALTRPLRQLALPAAVVAVSLLSMAFAIKVFPRHVLLPSAAFTLLSAAGYAALLRRSPAGARGTVLAVALAALMLVEPVSVGARIAHGYTQPAEIDRAGLWLEAQRAPRLVATSLGRFQVALPVEVRSGLRLHTLPESVLERYDTVVVPAADASRFPSLAVEQTFADPGNPGGELVALAARSRARDRIVPSGSVQGNDPEAARASDGDVETAWKALEGETRLEIRWPAPRTLTGVRVVAGAERGSWPQPLVLEGLTGDGWVDLPAFPMRPTRTRRQAPPHGQWLVLTPERTLQGVRLRRPAGGPWSVAEVQVLEPDPAGR